MEKNKETIELDYKGGSIIVTQHLVANQTIYRIIFADKKNPLVITRALTKEAERWWTSIPEGRQAEAEEIGSLIAAYIKSKQ